MLNEEVIDVVAEEVTEQPVPVVEEQPQISGDYLDAYKQYKQTKYKLKKLKDQVRNNVKAQRGFGYTYQEISYD